MKKEDSQESRRDKRGAGMLVILNYMHKHATGDVEIILERRDLPSFSSCHFDTFCHLRYNSWASLLSWAEEKDLSGR